MNGKRNTTEICLSTRLQFRRGSRIEMAGVTTFACRSRGHLTSITPHFTKIMSSQLGGALGLCACSHTPEVWPKMT
jgi:hypothetical protein